MCSLSNSCFRAFKHGEASDYEIKTDYTDKQINGEISVIFLKSMKTSTFLLRQTSERTN